VPFHCKGYGSNPRYNILTYNMYEHEDEEGLPCHGKHDTSGEPRPMPKPRLSRDMVTLGIGISSCAAKML